MYIKVKRYFDILISASALIVLSPVFFLIALAIKLDSSGTIFFKQGRLGKDGKEFAMYKFRSMVTNAERSGTGLFNYQNDPRVTKVGRFLRDTSLDELPQLLNVLKGDMSLVGPRPAVTYELGDYATLNKRYKKRFCVLPGITGLAQVCGRNEIPWDEKVNYDNEYVDKSHTDGFETDVSILLKTITVVFKSKDIYENKQDEDVEDVKAAELAAAEVIYNAHKQEE